MPVGTAINCPILGCLIGGLRRADMRSLVKWEKSGDLLGFIMEVSKLKLGENLYNVGIFLL